MVVYRGIVSYLQIFRYSHIEDAGNMARVCQARGVLVQRSKSSLVIVLSSRVWCIVLRFVEV